MAIKPPEDEYLRNRNPPPVPPKPSSPTSISTSISSSSLSRRRGRLPPSTPVQLKPLPPTPLSEDRDGKPLPELPTTGVKWRATALWVLGFGAWFAVIVLMLPVIMEREEVLGGMRGWIRAVFLS
ncbi:hypothetical protein SVAN01_10867 [Stagonosporopsis vannaccii]|nr:hypothetical protein SVAN01_10867 [Stagonosporopsis vannaccii]